MPPAEPNGSSGSSRPLPRLLLVLAAALLVARIGTGVWEQAHPPTAVNRVAWVEIDRAADEARRSHKPILYEFGADWCGPCQLMAREVFADESHARQIGMTFVPVRVLDRQREEGQNPPDVDRLENAYRITAFPTLVVAWPGESHFEITNGYRGPEATMDWLRRAAARGRMREWGVPDSTAPPR